MDCDDVTCHDTDECPPPDVAPMTAAEIQALLNARCAPCHFTDQPSARLSLQAPFEAAVVGVPSSQNFMERIKAGDRAGSYLFHKIRYSHLQVEGGGGEGMPPVGRLNAAQVEGIGRWIDGLTGR